MSQFWDVANFYFIVFSKEWLDSLWLLAAPMIVHRGQRIKAMLFAMLCILTLRLQVQTMDACGFPKGLTGLLSWELLPRGFTVYGIFNLIYLGLSYVSPTTRGPIYLAASLSIFFMAFVASTIVLLI